VTLSRRAASSAHEVCEARERRRRRSEASNPARVRFARAAVRSPTGLNPRSSHRAGSSGIGTSTTSPRPGGACRAISRATIPANADSPPYFHWCRIRNHSGPSSQQLKTGTGLTPGYRDCAIRVRQLPWTCSSGSHSRSHTGQTDGQSRSRSAPSICYQLRGRSSYQSIPIAAAISTNGGSAPYHTENASAACATSIARPSCPRPRNEESSIDGAVP